MTFEERITPSGISASDKLTISPDDKYLYHEDINGAQVFVFSRNTTTGELTLVETITDGTGGAHLQQVTDLKVSPGGAFLYVSAIGDDVITVFSRDSTTGRLTFANEVSDGRNSTLRHLAISPDGGFLLATETNRNEVLSFTRDATTGALTLVDSERDGSNGVDGLDGVHGVAVSPDGKHVYTSARRDDKVATFFLDDGVPSVDLGCAGGSVVTVLNTNDSGAGSLRQALVDADDIESGPGVFPDQATICFDPSLSGQTITLSSELPIDKNIKMDATDLSSRLTISGGEVTRVFRVDAVHLTIKGLRIMNGVGGGGSPAINGGGAIRAIPGAEIELESCEFSNNRSNPVNDVQGASGGAITLIQKGSLRITDCTFRNNEAGSGAAFYVDFNAFPGTT